MTFPPLLRRATALAFVAASGPGLASAQTSIRIAPGDRTVVAVGQRFDLRVEATGADEAGAPPSGLTVTIDDRDVTALNILDPGVDGERGAGGTGATDGALLPRHRAAAAPGHTTNFLVRDRSFDAPGTYTIRAHTDDGATAEATVVVEPWQDSGAGAPRVRNVILLLGDGMGIAARTAARIVSRGVSHGKANDWLAMDRMEVTGLVMTTSLNSVITDSAPGMSALSTGSKGNNNQVGVFPDNTVDDAFDNPRIEYLGELMRRVRGEGFRTGLVTTADVADATPAGNAVHTANRNALAPIARQYLAEREENGVSVLLGGGSRHFTRAPSDGAPTLLAEFEAAGFASVTTAAEVEGLLSSSEPPPAQLLGLFHPGHMNVAFDKLGAGRYSDELSQPAYASLRDQPMLDDMTRLALASLDAHAPDGFYLMVEGASIDKQAHAVDAERTIWDTIEFDRAVAVALEYAARTNGDDDPDNETLVIVTADHETGGMALVAVGNERYDPARIGVASRDYAAVFRFEANQTLNFETNYSTDSDGYPTDPDPSRKLLVAWGAGPDRFENWMSNRRVVAPAVHGEPEPDGRRVAVANPARDGDGDETDNRTVEGDPIPGFLVQGVIEDGALGCPDAWGCPDDTAAMPQVISGHTASDIPLSASGPGALQFTGTYDNTEVFLKMLRALGGGASAGGGRP